MRKIMVSKNLQNMLEKIIFDEIYLFELKNTINKVAIGQISPKSVRKLIIEHKTHLFEKILGLFPYYLKYISNNRSLEQFTGESMEKNVKNNTELVKELEEKNKFLEEIGIRVNGIYKKLELEVL